MKTKFSMAARVWTTHLLLVLVCFLFVAAILDNHWWIRYPVNLLLLAGGVMLVYGEGAYRGERACTLAASLESYRAEGKTPSAEDEKQVWNWKNGLQAALIAWIPLALVALFNIVAQSGALGIPAAQMAGLSQEEAELVAFSVPSISNIVARAVFMPYNLVYDWVSEAVLPYALLLVSMIMPAAVMVGYMQGPRLRRKKLKEIELGKKRKLRKMKKGERQPRQPRPPKAEV